MQNEIKIGIVLGVVVIGAVALYYFQKDTSTATNPEISPLKDLIEEPCLPPAETLPPPPAGDNTLIEPIISDPCNPTPIPGLEPEPLPESEPGKGLPDTNMTDRDATQTKEPTPDEVADETQEEEPETPVVEEEEEAVPEQEELPDHRYYTVEQGDNLFRIAEKYYGLGRHWEVIYNANREKIGDNPENLKVGMRLRIPYPEEIIGN